MGQGAGGWGWGCRSPGAGPQEGDALWSFGSQWCARLQTLGGQGQGCEWVLLAQTPHLSVGLRGMEQAEAERAVAAGPTGAVSGGLRGEPADP